MLSVISSTTDILISGLKILKKLNIFENSDGAKGGPVALVSSLPFT